MPSDDERNRGSDTRTPSAHQVGGSGVGMGHACASLVTQCVSCPEHIMPSVDARKVGVVTTRPSAQASGGWVSAMA